MRMLRMTMPDLVELTVEDTRWQDHNLEGLAPLFCGATLDHFDYVRGGFEISLLGCGDERIAELNTQFRGKPTSTNVLSWPSEERGSRVPGQHPDPVNAGTGDRELGDIAIAFGVCQAEATAANKPFEQHVGHLLVHATLHLLGYDHILEQDAHLMEKIERQVLATMGQPDPYGDD